MARLPRIDLPGVPQHVLQRGNNRTPCFFQPSDYTFYLGSLKQAAHQHDCAVYAYVLMTHHVHLLVSGAETGCISAMMQSLGRRYGRSGTLWEGRFKSSVIDSKRYLLNCMRYIELNPVRPPWSDSLATTSGRATAAMRREQYSGRHLFLGNGRNDVQGPTLPGGLPLTFMAQCLHVSHPILDI